MKLKMKLRRQRVYVRISGGFASGVLYCIAYLGSIWDL